MLRPKNSVLAPLPDMLQAKAYKAIIAIKNQQGENLKWDQVRTYAKSRPPDVT